jgi:hypothetical protein
LLLDCVTDNQTPAPWSIDLYLKMAREVNLVTALQNNMNHWATERGMTPYLSDEQWAKIFNNRKQNSYDDKWCKQMAHDLKWVLRHQIIGGTSKQRNTYWDEFAPAVEDIAKVKQRLMLLVTEY